MCRAAAASQRARAAQAVRRRLPAIASGPVFFGARRHRPYLVSGCARSAGRGLAAIKAARSATVIGPSSGPGDNAASRHCSCTFHGDGAGRLPASGVFKRLAIAVSSCSMVRPAAKFSLAHSGAQAGAARGEGRLPLFSFPPDVSPCCRGRALGHRDSGVRGSIFK